MNKQLRLLELHEGKNGETTIYRLEKGWTLNFVLGPSLADKHVRLFINHPEDGRSGPNRHVYRELTWQNPTDSKFDVYDNFAEVHMVLAGSFNYFFTIDGSAFQVNANGSGYFLVDPNLTAGKFDEKVPLDCIACVTVMPKLMGPLSTWKDRLRVAKECKYNMIHFTPVQELGASNSGYCLKNQLYLSPAYLPNHKERQRLDVLKSLVTEMRSDWDTLSLTDLVFNHTANESPWIKEHPECAYNLVNSPHLKAAYVLDRIICHFSLDIAEGKFANKGIPVKITNDDHLNALCHVLRHEVVPKHNLHEYFLMHIDDVVKEFRLALLDGQKGHAKPGQELKIIEHPKMIRLRASVDMPLAVHMFNVKHPGLSQKERIDSCCNALRARLQELNDAKYREIQEHLDVACNNVRANAHWRFVDPGGEKKGTVTPKEPIMWDYFTLPSQKMTVLQEETAMNTDQGAYCMAHNGWVMGYDAKKNFADPGEWVYFRRELVVWGDSVKLRYGSGPSDCPFLWMHMAEYVTTTAAVFHGVRLDNCHSTPIHVAEYMLDEARKVRPDLYVIAELFTSDTHTDNTFINRLGINSLIREGLNPEIPKELGAYVHKYGGVPVGSFIQPPARPLAPTNAHAIFFDQTHDNNSPTNIRTAVHALAVAGMVSIACCASGSNMGFDQLVPHKIDVVTEDRLYPAWTSEAKPGSGEVNINSGIMAAKRALNKLHYDLGMAGFNQVYVHNMNDDVISVTRHNPTNHSSIIMVAHTAWEHKDSWSYIEPLNVEGYVEEIVLEAMLTPPGHAAPKFKLHPKFVNGYSNYNLHLSENIQIEKSSMVALQGDCVDRKDHQKVEFHHFPPGSIIAFKVQMPPDVRARVMKVRQTLSLFGYRMRTFSARQLSDISSTEVDCITAGLSLHAINRVLFRSNGEEESDGRGFGAYNIPNYGALPFCGLQGVVSVLAKIRLANVTGHPLCNNLRAGNWLLDYVATRLKVSPGTEKLGEWLEKAFAPMHTIPAFLKPCYFDAIVTGVYNLSEEVTWAQMSAFISNGSTFVRALAMGSPMFCSYVPSALLPPLSPYLQPPYPPTTEDKTQQAIPTLAAGLPHFTTGIWRNWGRDTFIAMRGLLLLTARFQDARFIILGFAGTLRHGLIPNLLGEGKCARYNCRDAVWWWLQCIHQYVREAPNGDDLLNDRVARLYPTDDTCEIPAPGTADQPLHEVMQEALQRHATGQSFRERNAGHQIDEHMFDEGFNMKFGIDWKTGFVYGGNEHNCGTWMDKMGSSEKAGNKGKPATPRDGSAIELVGLCKAVVSWLADLHKAGKYPHEGVTTPDDKLVKWSEWSALIQRNFERHFYVDTEENCKDHNANLINKRGIYKDSVGSTFRYTDYQLRPNQAIALVVAPELFSPENAWHALNMMEKHLMGPLGMKTLDESDLHYRGYYNNSDDSNDYHIAKGLNYHQGPEWVWPVGFYLRAKLYFAQALEKQTKQPYIDDVVTYIKHTITNHRVHLMSSDWRSLPELTNKNGAVCNDSCAAQAWSVSCLLELLFDMEKQAQQKRKKSR